MNHPDRGSTARVGARLQWSEAGPSPQTPADSSPSNSPQLARQLADLSRSPSSQVAFLPFFSRKKEHQPALFSSKSRRWFCGSADASTPQHQKPQDALEQVFPQRHMAVFSGEGAVGGFRRSSEVFPNCSTGQAADRTTSRVEQRRLGGEDQVL